jgi:hypothetical protein
MAAGSDCKIETVNGAKKCITHDVNLEERGALESKGVVIQQPQVPGLVCPVSLKLFSSADPIWDDLEQA